MFAIFAAPLRRSRKNDVVCGIPSKKDVIMARKLSYLLLTLCLCLPSFTQAKNMAPHSGPTFVVDAKVLPKRLKIIAYGDIRFTDLANHQATDPDKRLALVRKIAEEKPDALLIGGDIPLSGSNSADWTVMQQETKPWRDAGLRVYPALGNHELTPDEDSGLANWWKEFPELKGKRWYSVEFGNCYFIALDSDTGLTPGSDQRKWVESQIADLPPSTNFLFIFMHHPAFTASTNHTGHAPREQEQEFAKWLEASPALKRVATTVIGGHVHNYERYEYGGITFLVSGGGGATPYIYSRSPEDKYQGSGPTYHFVEFTVDGKKLSAEMEKLEGGGFSVKDSFEEVAPSWARRRKSPHRASAK